MPNTKSAKKALRQNKKRRLRNRSQRSALRTFVKKARLAIQSAGVETAESAVRVAVKKLDQAAAKRLIHPNKAARLKSRLMRRLGDRKRPSVAESA
ncbi:MAG TPA: 30S ribosomal protein S20 [Planctomycetaceae bacterium]|nr:30S ribosomal protein S20 [Planctomycetaceae bacterium]